MRTVIVDKIASVTQACGLSNELRVADRIPCEEGIVLAVEILTNKSQYNTLELTSGRMAKVGRGDVVVGALGHRKALFGYSGHLPAKLAPAPSKASARSAAREPSGAAAEAPLSAAERARQRRVARETLGGQLMLWWKDLSPKGKSAAGVVTGLVIIGLLMGVVSVFLPSKKKTGPTGPEPAEHHAPAACPEIDRDVERLGVGHGSLRRSRRRCRRPWTAALRPSSGGTRWRGRQRSDRSRRPSACAPSAGSGSRRS